MSKQPRMAQRATNTGNELMTWLVSEYGTRNWRNVLKQTKGGMGAIEAIEAALIDIGAQAPAALMIGGTGALKDRYDFGEATGEEIQAVIANLKSSGRLIQLGQGRGYALVLLDATPLGANKATATVTPSPPAKAPGRGPRATISDDRHEPRFFLEQLGIAIEGYQAKITALENENERLRADLVTAGADTWS